MQSSKTIYLIPGLGFDCRIFRNLEVGPIDKKPLEWIEPLPKESLQEYAGRMAEGIQEEDQPITIVGHSFGGHSGTGNRQDQRGPADCVDL